MHYASGVKQLDAGSAGGKADPVRAAYVGGAIRYLLWWRTQYGCAATRGERWACRLAYGSLVGVTLCAMSAVALLKRRPAILTNYVRGMRAGRRFAHSPEGRSLPAY